MDKLEQLYNKGLSRRNFLAGAGALGAASVLAGCSDNGTASSGNTAYNDIDILNFALNLEYLEAEFYLRAATGSGLAAADVTGTGTAGSVNGGTKITGLTALQQGFVNELAYTEQQHVRFLRTALGSMAVARPAIDLTAGFMGAVTAANTITNAALPTIPTTFSPFANYDGFLIGGFVFEDVGVTAYNGAAPLISVAGIAAGYLAAAAGIMAVEAYHSASARTQLIGNAIVQGSTAYPYPLYANRISALRAALGGGNETPLAGFSAAPATIATVTPSAIVAADSTNSIAFHRTTDQVLHIVYGTFSNTAGSTTPAAGVAGGGFFPSGMNGNIKVTLS